ncbi:MAG: hypothetical protein JO227_22280 [Acetobacteraceae bacterium]|nr:hypothetical protein [Acetobacteraceae bacterium]
MKYLVKSVAVAGGMAIAATAWSQSYPGPKPSGHQYGGSGYGISLSSPSTPATATPSMATPPPAPAAPPTSPSKHTAHSKKTHHRPALTGNTTGQLNREELARLQSGSSSTGPALTPTASPSQR